MPKVIAVQHPDERGRSLVPQGRSRLVELLLESLHEPPLAAADAHVEHAQCQHLAVRGRMAQVGGGADARAHAKRCSAAAPA